MIPNPTIDEIVPHCSSTKTTLVLNSNQRLVYHWKKSKKPKQFFGAKQRLYVRNAFNISYLFFFFLNIKIFSTIRFMNMGDIKRNKTMLFQIIRIEKTSVVLWLQKNYNCNRGSVKKFDASLRRIQRAGSILKISTLFILCPGVSILPIYLLLDIDIKIPIPSIDAAAEVKHWEQK